MIYTVWAKMEIEVIKEIDATDLIDAAEKAKELKIEGFPCLRELRN